MKSILKTLMLGSIVVASIQAKAQKASLLDLTKNSESITGKKSYLNTPYVTAGDRLYMVGHQNGQFPDLGWHVTGEMGGIWDHPIKLMDGFSAKIQANGTARCLDQATSFVNFPYGNKHIYQDIIPNLSIQRFQFVPDKTEAVVVEYTFENHGTSPQTLEFEFTGHSDLRPVWLGERNNMIDAEDKATWRNASQSWVIKDQKNPWHVQFGASISTKSHHQNTSDCQFKSQGLGTKASLIYNIVIAPKSKFILPIVIAGSYQSEGDVNKTFGNIQKNAFALLQQKIKRYESIAKQSSLTVPDKKLEQAFRWVKYNTDWLVRDVPAVGRGMSAGMPDYPWWFGTDAEYTLKGLVATGKKDLVYDAVEVLNKLSEKENGNGRIVHEVSSNGVVFNPGNVNETPQFASMIWEIYQWTGDKSFLQKYYPTIKKGLDWLLKENDKDKNLLPDGFGMMEIHGLNSEMIDVAVYTQKAFADAAQIAKLVGDSEQALQYERNANQIKHQINSDFWVPESQSFADFIGTREQTLHLIDDAIVRADTLQKPWAVAELKQLKSSVEALPLGTKKGFALHHNWVVNTPMEMGIADPEKAKLALVNARKYTNPFGAFVTGIDRDESSNSEEAPATFVRKSFTYTGAVMTLPTGVAAIGENNYGNPDGALWYLNKMTKTFSYVLPGAIYEVSPDYGMMCQAWNLYSYATPIIKQFFGVQPQAGSKLIVIQPQMPSTWNNAKIENVQIGDNSLSVSYQKVSSVLKVDFNQTKSSWRIKVQYPKGKFTSWKLNGKTIKPVSSEEFDFIWISGLKNKVEVL
ncbi:glycogen debranching protein [Flectobacillus sp. DC10W]|jgi:glycogen debranching enzyme|uniref:Glycogen debranching protein n=1 Tax=Flectobacillus longus TaxID=2984207 RepID=A0ABT6YL23_9BACT|nr:glycogen debranching protein [Flectobacillus longus]MDI9864291.1 glycogen debranching protein [Flectobacillus longus]